MNISYIKSVKNSISNYNYIPSLNDGDSLGIFTKSHVTLTTKGLERCHDFILQDQSAKLLPKERVCNCLKKRVDKNKNRTVMYNGVRDKTHWANVQRCGSVWTCPVCAKQITEKRRNELSQAVEKWKAKGGHVRLLTLTFSHSKNQPLKFLLYGFQKAIKRFYETTSIQSLFRKYGIKHKIKSLEVTYGQNGWHPHHHILLLCDSDIDLSVIRDFMAEHWIKCCVKSGLDSPSMEHGLDIRDGSYADKYVSKWGIEHEMTKGNVKKGRNGGFSPFDLLNYSRVDAVINDRSCSSLWQEFAIAMKGQRQLVWSRGLKKLLEIEEKTDAELAEETENVSITLAEVEDFIFNLLAHYQHRHTYLECLKNDYKNGCFGCGTAEQLLFYLLELDLKGVGDDDEKERRRREVVAHPA